MAYHESGRTAPEMEQWNGQNPHGTWAFLPFHSQIGPFARVVSGMCSEYKMLGFSLDLHHRQRYFHICDC